MIYAFIVEDEHLARTLIQDHFKKGEITFAESFDNEERDKVAEAISSVEE